MISQLGIVGAHWPAFTVFSPGPSALGLLPFAPGQSSQGVAY